MDSLSQRPIGELPQERFKIEKLSRNTGRILYINAQGQEKVYNTKISGQACSDLSVLKVAVKLLNAHVPQVDLGDNDALRIKNKGIKKITPEENKYIFEKEGSKKFEKSFNQVVKVATKNAHLAKPSVLVSPRPSDREILSKDISKITSRYAEEDRDLEFYRICASLISYEDWKPGEEIGYNGYKVAEQITNERGLKIVVLVSEHEGMKPIFCCRGTKTIQNVIDDTGKNIGEYGLEPSLASLGNKLVNFAEKYGPVVLTGHSLGGAHAQLLASHFAGVKKGADSIIDSVYHFNAPGIGRDNCSRFEEAKKTFADSGRFPQVHSVRHHGDVVYHAGGKHLRADHTYKYTNIGRVGPAAAHSISNFGEVMKIKKSRGKRFSHKAAKIFIGGLKGSVGSVAHVAMRALCPADKKSEYWQEPLATPKFADENLRVIDALSSQTVELQKADAGGGKGGFRQVTIEIDGKKKKLFLKPIDTHEFSNIRFIHDECAKSKDESILKYMPRVYGRFGDYMVMEDLRDAPNGEWQQKADLKISLGSQSDPEELEATNRPKGLLEKGLMQFQDNNASLFLALDRSKLQRTRNAIAGSEQIFKNLLLDLSPEVLPKLLDQFKELEKLLDNSPVAFIGASIFVFVSPDGKDIKIRLADPAHCIARPLAATEDRNIFFSRNPQSFQDRLNHNKHAIKAMAAVVKFAVNDSQKRVEDTDLL